MSDIMKKNEFDAIIVGSGTGGATVAKELSKQKKKVLILEQGTDAPLKETISSIALIAKEVPVGDNMKVMRAITTGGSTALYLAVTKLPSTETFSKLGIDITKEIAEVKQELPIAELPDELLTTQTKRFRECATELGYSMKKNLMMIDQSKCSSKYCYEAKWKARSFVEEATKNGAMLINRATVQKILVDKNRAIGVEYKLQKGLMSEACQAYGKKIIIAAGSLATPKILLNSGIRDVGNNGYFSKLGSIMFGTIPGLNAEEGFVGCIDADLGDGISMGDGSMSKTLFKLLMLSKFNMINFNAHSKTLVAGVTVDDPIGGMIKKNGRYYKKFSPEVFQKLKKGEDAATKILKKAGAKNIFPGGRSAANPGLVLRIQEHLDDKLQTKINDLYVCDTSVIPDGKMTPTFPLICLGKYLSKHLLSTL